MPSKGIESFACIGLDDAAITFTTPTDLARHTQSTTYTREEGNPPPIRHNNMQINESDIGLFDHYGTFVWTATIKGKTIGTEAWNIAPLTGAMQTDSGPFNLMAQVSSSNSSENWALSYGFYDSGSGYSGMTNQDQAWVYLTPDVSNWMTQLVEQHPAIGRAPFAGFVLPGAHDAGTYDVSAIENLPNLANTLVKIVAAVGIGALSAAIPFLPALLTILEAAGTPTLKKALQNLAVTQTNDAAGQLDMGVRYFDFRPGYCISGMSLDGIYHQHGFVPGVLYQSFLEQLFTWLKSNPGEIAVVSANFQGFTAEPMKPGIASLEAIVHAAQAAAGAGTIQLGGPADLARSYNELVASNRRLIFLNQIDPTAPLPSQNNTRKYDSYSADAYATQDVAPILRAIGAMRQSGQAGHDYTVLQLQGTASVAPGVAPGVISDDSWAGSALMMTKAQFDRATYPWVATNLRRNLGSRQLVVLLNDFCDNALAVTAMTIMAADHMS